jgi:hypothetical protein
MKPRVLPQAGGRTAEAKKQTSAPAARAASHCHRNPQPQTMEELKEEKNDVQA